MKSTTRQSGFETLRQTAASFKKSTVRKTAIEDMTLDQAIDAKKKYLIWIEKNPTHPQAHVKKHIYETYLLPHIEELQLAHDVNVTLISPPPTLEELRGQVAT